MPVRHLSTSKVAKFVGVHPNTVRLYEQWGFLPAVPRSPAGYRLFSERHLDQMRLARTALQYPYPGGKGLVVELVTRAAQGDLGGALERAYLYLTRVRSEQLQAEAAVDFLVRWAQGVPSDSTSGPLQIGEVAKVLNVTRDMLRNWERNGLIQVPRHPRSRYRLYTSFEIGRLRVIRTLRSAGYSMIALLRMLHALDQGLGKDLRQALDTPGPGEDIYFAADRWITTLALQEQRALDVISQIETMIRKQRSVP